MYLGDNLLNKGITGVRRGVRPRGAGGADPADAGARPADVRRRRAGGRPGRAAGREAEGAEERSRAGRRLHVLAGGVRLGEADQAQLPQRAGDHRRDPGPDRPRPRGPAAPGRGLVEGHRQARGHARGQPADPRYDRAPHRRHGRRRVAHRGQGRRSRPAPSIERSVIRGPGGHRRRRADRPRLRRAVHVDRPDVRDPRLRDRAQHRAGRQRASATWPTASRTA